VTTVLVRVVVSEIVEVYVAVPLVMIVVTGMQVVMGIRLVIIFVVVVGGYTIVVL